MTYKLLVVRESRVLLAIVMITLSTILSLWLYVNIDLLVLKIIAPVLVIPIVSIVSVYSTFSKLYVQVENDEIQFHWSRKLIFNFSSVKKINLHDIQYLVIDQSPLKDIDFLRAIVTDNTKIVLGLGKNWRYDADSFIAYLKQGTRAEVVDSWDVIRKRGWLKVAYYLTGTIIIGITILILWLLINNRLSMNNVGVWFSLLGSYFAFIPSWFVLKNKVKKVGNIV